MSETSTAHYGLNQWDASDHVLRTEFNEDNAKVDSALAGLAEQVAGKASQSDLASLTSTVATKASQSDLNTLTDTVNTKASQTDLISLTNMVNTKASQSDLTSLTNTVATKASQADLTSLTNTVNTKASQSALNTLTSTVNTKASQSDLNTLRSDMTAGDLWVKLAELTTTAASNSVSFDVSGINFTDYWQVRLLYLGGHVRPLYIRINGDTGNNYPCCGFTTYLSTPSTYLGSLSSNDGHNTVGMLDSIPILPGCYPSFLVYCVSQDTYGSMLSQAGHSASTWETLRSFDFSCQTSSTIPSGTKVLLYGLRK